MTLLRLTIFVVGILGLLSVLYFVISFSKGKCEQDDMVGRVVVATLFSISAFTTLVLFWSSL